MVIQIITESTQIPAATRKSARASTPGSNRGWQARRSVPFSPVKSRILLALLVFALAPAASAAPLKSNSTPAPETPSKRVSPPKGIPIPPEIRAELEQGVADLGSDIEALRTTLKAKPNLLDLLPDV